MMNSDKNQYEILIVDDTPASLKALSSILDEHGYKVRPALNGELALSSIKKRLPDLILLDINMPGLNGYEVCKRIKDNEITKHIPILFISALGDIKDKIKAFRVGGVDYITKPFQLEEILSRVETHLNLRHFQRELEEKNKSLEKVLKELAETQNQLVQNEKMASLGVLSAGIAHEINNPVNAINSSSISLNRLFRKLFSLVDFYDEIFVNQPDDLKNSINEYKKEIDFNDLLEGIRLLTSNIVEGAQRTTNIVESLKIFAHLDKAEKMHTNLHVNLDSTVGLLHHRLNGRIKIIKKYGNIPEIDCYPGKLNQVFMNLLVNAIDSIERKNSNELNENQIILKTGQISRNKKEYIKIDISDKGVGMPPELVKRIFEPFYTTKDIDKGSGLGLSISHGIIKSHSGEIEVKSIVGKGTTFSILLPFK